MTDRERIEFRLAKARAEANAAFAESLFLSAKVDALSERAERELDEHKPCIGCAFFCCVTTPTRPTKLDYERESVVTFERHAGFRCERFKKYLAPECGTERKECYFEAKGELT